MSESYTGKIDRVELAEKGPSLVVMEQTDSNSDYEGKRFRCWAHTDKTREEKAPEWKSIEEFAAADSTITIDYHIDTYNGRNGPISKNMIDNVKMAEPQGDWSGGSPLAPRGGEIKVPLVGDELSKEAAEVLKKALAATVDEFVGGA